MTPSNGKGPTHEGLQALIAERTPENKTLEYKGRVPDKTDREIENVSKTVCAFANTAGGRIVLGMETDDDGLPTALKGIATEELDHRKQWLENRLRDLVQPVVPAMDIETVDIGNDEHVLVIDVAESWVGPHWYKTNKRFYRRRSEGNKDLEIGEVRSAFATSEGFTDRIRQFRMERIWRLQSERTPVAIRRGGRMVWHIVPRSAFSTTSSVDIEALEAHENRIEQMHCAGNHRFNMDGFVTFREWEPGGALGYTQVFRNGSIEGVFVLGTDERYPVVGCTQFEEDIIWLTRKYLEVAEHLRWHPPYFCFLTFVNAIGMEFIVPTRLGLGRRSEDRIAREETLVLPEFVLAERDVAPETALKPLFDSVWNTFGFRESYNYDEHGNWERLRR